MMQRRLALFFTRRTYLSTRTSGGQHRGIQSSSRRLAPSVPSNGAAALGKHQSFGGDSQQKLLLLPSRRFRSSKKRSKQRSKQKQSTRRKKEQPSASAQLLPTRGENGRLIMTEEQAMNDHSIRSLGVDGSNAKSLLHQTQIKLGFRQSMTHQVKGPPHERMFLAQIRIEMEPASLQGFPNLKCTTKEGENVNLISTGAARRKSRAEVLATMDLLAQLQECGIGDARNLPDLKAIRKQEAAEQYKEELRKAQMLLELYNVSRPHFETETRERNTSYSEVTMFLNNNAITASASGGSKAEAEGKAMIAAVGEPLENAIGKKRMEECESLIRDSPGGHVAALHVHPLPYESIDELIECLGSPSEHAERMKRHADEKGAYEAKFRLSREQRGKRQRRNDKNHVNTTQATNAAFQLEEETRAKKALEDPEGRQGRMKSIRDALSIKAIRLELINALKTEQVVVVSGGTGSGKSTQCPQYILENAIANGRGAETQIVVTQPRRIAAISVAERVAAERDETIGNSVGYTVRFNRQTPREVGGSIEFVTTGVLLRRLMNDPFLEGISHVVIDEVHERDIDTDFLLVLLKELLSKRPELRVILMSATLNAESFGQYFSQGREDETIMKPVPVMSVPSKTFHPVDVLHLEDMAGESNEMKDDEFPNDLQKLAKTLLEAHDQQLQLDLDEADTEEKASARLEARSYAEDGGEILGSSDSESDSDISDSDSDDERPKTRADVLRRAVSMRNASAGGLSANYPSYRTMAAKREIGEITVSMVAKIAAHVAQQETNAGRKGSILCFLPGWDEIKAARATLEEVAPPLSSKMSILPLHSTVPKEEQHKVFEPAEDGTIKVILATNIAESSLTIDDVLVVIDSGLVREMNYAAQSNMSTMETVPTSKASATQRLGRAGRVAPGKCYRIYSRGALQAMLERPMPEIQRTALESTCLQTCSMTSDGVAKFLQRAMDPPTEEAVSFAMNRLVKLGAIEVGVVLTPEGRRPREAMTPVGRCLSRLPLDPAIGRMLIMGCLMNCLDPILTAAASLGSRDAFYSPLGMREEARNIRQSFSDTSDLMATVRAYNTLQDIIENEGWDYTRRWASENFISLAAMSSIRSVRSQLLSELNRIGLVPNSDLVRVRTSSKQLRKDASVNQNASANALFSAVWATGLAGNIAARRRLGTFGTLRTRSEEHAGLHPSSVAFHRKPPRVRLPRWFIYHEMVLSSQVFLRGCTALRPEQILLFGGYSLNAPKQPKQQPQDDDWIAYCLESTCEQFVLDDWIVVEGPCRDTIDLLSCVRNEINAALEIKVMHPRQPLPEISQSIIETVSYMLGDEDNVDEM